MHSEPPDLKPPASAALPAGGISEGLARAALWAAIAAVAAYHLALVLMAVAIPEPMGLWETVYASIARAWPHQYQWGYYVVGHDNYGPGYPAFCRPFLLVFSDVYVAHRVANLVALLGACGLAGWMLRANRCSAVVTAALVAILFAINAGSYSIQARPDFLVLLEMAAIMAVGQGLAEKGMGRGARRGLLLGVLTLAAYLTKSYSLFAWGAVIAYVGVARGPRQAAAPAAVSGIILAAGVWLYARYNPYYLIETFGAHIAHTAPDFGWLVHQVVDFSVLACGPIAAAVAGTALRMRSPAGGATPFRLAPGARYWAWLTVLAAIVLLAGLGWHTGAYLTYFFHLILVPLCLLAGVASGPGNGGRDPLWACLALLANLAVLMILAPALPRPDPGWAELREDVIHQSGPVTVDSIMEPLSRLRGDVEVADSGMFSYAMDEPGIIGMPSGALQRARAETAEFGRRQAERFREHPPRAIYLDYVEFQKPGGRPGEMAFEPRNGLPWFLGDGLSGYSQARVFQIFPYYYATNDRRQGAGRWSTLVVKWLRKP